MSAPRVYLQTQNAHGSWVTPTDARGARFEFALSAATLRQLEACPANARLVYVATGETATTKHSVRQFGLHEGYRPKPRRPLVPKPNRGMPSPVTIPVPNTLLRSGHGPIVKRIMCG